MNNSKPESFVIDVFFKTNVNINEVTNETTHATEGNEAAEHVLVVSLIIVSIYLAAVNHYYHHKHPTAKLRQSNLLITIASTLLLLECCWFEVEIILSHTSIDFCHAFTATNVTIATTIKTFIYAILWLRQEGLYKGPMSENNRKAKLISRLTLGGILVCAIIQIVVLSLIQHYSENGECMTVKMSGALEIIVPIVFALSSAFQIILLGLTLYPVIHQIREGVISKRRNQLKKVAKKLSICTAICIAVDVLFLIVVLLKPAYAPVTFIPISYAFNTAINTFATMFSFVNYRQRLWPFTKMGETPHSSKQDTLSLSTRNSAARI